MNSRNARRILLGTVIKHSSKNTLSVLVERIVSHPKYIKRIKRSQKYLVHIADDSTFNAGEKVQIMSCRPISKRKSWYVEEVVS